MMRGWLIQVCVFLMVVWVRGDGVTVSYQLPASPVEATYRVTMVASPADNPDWIVATFLSAADRTVTVGNGGVFTDVWDGLDDNGMPVPPGEYVFKGIYSSATVWGVNGESRTLIPHYRVGAADSWAPSIADGSNRYPRIFGWVFSGMSSIAAAPDGIAAFSAYYVENSKNPFKVDLNEPIDPDQVTVEYGSSGWHEIGEVATDGEVVWLSTGDVVGRADKASFGNITYGGNPAYQLDAATPSMAAWKSGVERYLYLVQASPVNKVVVLEGNDGTLLETDTSLNDPVAITLARSSWGSHAYVLHWNSVSSRWVVSQRAIDSGTGHFTGSWSEVFEVKDSGGTPVSGRPTDVEVDSSGNFYIAAPEDSNQIFKYNSSGIYTAMIGAAGTQNGSYNDQILMAPTKLTLWTSNSVDRLLVLENEGPGRISEWTTGGSLLREWFLSHNSIQGYCLDPDNPTHLYASDAYGGSLMRYIVDYSTGDWLLDSVWEGLCMGTEFPGGISDPRIFKVSGNKYLTFAGGAGMQGGATHFIYRWTGSTWVPSSGVVIDGGNRYFWNDANNNQLADSSEYSSNAANLPGGDYWGDYWSEDLDLIIQAFNSGNKDLKFWRLQPTGFDAHGNPQYDGSQWEELPSNPYHDDAGKKQTHALWGGNETEQNWSIWMDTAGNRQTGYFVSESSGQHNPYGPGEFARQYGQSKLNFFAPDGSGSYELKWRVGTESPIRSASTGAMYTAFQVTGPTYGLVGVLDNQGLYHVFTTNGLFVDTLMVDQYRYGYNSVYATGDGTMWGRHFLNPDDGKVYLLQSRSGMSAFEIENWTNGVVSDLTVNTGSATLGVTNIAHAEERAVAMRGGYGADGARVMRFYPAIGESPPLDGSTNGWQSAIAVSNRYDGTRWATVQCMYDTESLYFRWHVRLGQAFAAETITDPQTLFLQNGMDSLGFYLQGDPSQAGGGTNGRSGDVRVEFAVVDYEGETQAVALGMFPYWSGGSAAPKTYSGASGSVTYEHVALLNEGDYAYFVDGDSQGFVLTARVPRSALGIDQPFGQAFDGMVNFGATFGGAVKTLWCNTLGMSGTTAVGDDAVEARLYPGAMGWGEFVGADSVDINIYGVCAPWGGEGLTNWPGDGVAGHIFANEYFVGRTYPPDGTNSVFHIDTNAVYESMETRNAAGVTQQVQWTVQTTSGRTIPVAAGAPQLGYAVTYIWMPSNVTVETEFTYAGSWTYQALCHGIWLNGTKVAENPENTWNGATTYPVPVQNLNYQAGWNQIFYKAHSQWGGLSFGVRLNGPDELLWQVRMSPFEVTAPEILHAAGASDVGLDSAQLNAQLISGSSPFVTVYWGTEDQGQSKSGWDGSHELGVSALGNLSYVATNLTSDQDYYYMFHASNSVDEVWGATAGTLFRTYGSPSIGAGVVSAVGYTNATLNGVLSSDGSATTTGMVFWGGIDRGNVTNGWDGMHVLGEISTGALVHVATGLSDGTTYTFRFMAANEYGEDWASGSFATLAYNTGGGTGDTYYVNASTGSDGNSGTSEGSAWATIAKAAATLAAGDTVFIMNGTYHESMNGEYANINITQSGSEGQYITYRNYPGHQPLIVVDTWNGVQLWNVSYVELNGLTVQGLADPASIVGDAENSADRQTVASDRQYFGNGISIFGDTGNHNIRILNCKVSRVGGNGIAGANSTQILIQGNEIWNTSHRSDAGNSAISFINMNDTLTTVGDYGLIIAGNECSDAINMLDFSGFPQITDGNGIILDSLNDSRSNAGYSHRTLIVNNVLYNNGGRGIHIYKSDHVDVVNNTCWMNLRSSDLQVWEGELSAVNSTDVNFHNNIAVARHGVRDYNIAAGNAGGFKNNLVISTRSDQVTIDGSNMTSPAPIFVSATTDRLTQDFRLNGSTGLDVGLATLAPAQDARGVTRPQGSGIDLGAYEWTPSGGGSVFKFW